MANRRVTGCIKDKDGDILALCNPFEDWSFRSKKNAIEDIENDFHNYYVFNTGEKVDIFVVNGTTEKCLRSDPAKTETNILEDLPAFYEQI